MWSNWQKLKLIRSRTYAGTLQNHKRLELLTVYEQRGTAEQHVPSNGRERGPAEELTDADGDYEHNGVAGNGAGYQPKRPSSWSAWPAQPPPPRKTAIPVITRQVAAKSGYLFVS